MLLRSLPYPQPEEIVQLREVNERGVQVPFTEPNFADIRARSKTLEGVALAPLEIEFWHERPFRLHDRVVFRRQGLDEAWTRERLYP